MLKKLFFIFARYSGLNTLYERVSTHRIRIIGYHSVSPVYSVPGTEYSHISMTPELFESQMKYLVDHGHTFVRLSDLKDDAVAHMYKPTVIYFDDGFKDNIDIALPILQKYNIPATFFVVPRYVEQGSPVYMSWDEIRTLDSAGMEIGSHTYHHVALTDVGQDVVRDELQTSKEKIEQELGHTISAFSYPKGRANAQIADMVKDAGYACAVTTAYGTNGTQTYLFALKKVAPRVYENMQDFSVRLNIFNALYDCRN